jgi:hypothetical protein
MVDSTLSDNPSVDNTFKEKTPVDNNTRKADAPVNDLHILPIRYWLISVVMAALFVGGISGWQTLFQSHVDVPPATEYNIQRLSTPAEGLRVVSVGDSYSRFSFPYDEKLEKIASERGLSLKFTRFTKNNGKQRHFAVLLPHVLAAKPDIMLLEADPFIVDSLRRSSSFLGSFRRGIRNIKMKVQGKKSGLLSRENSKAGPERTDDWTTKPEMVEDRLREMKKGLIPSPPIMPEAYEKFLTAAKDQGIRVILLDLGHSKVVNEAISSEFKDQITANLATLEARYPIEVWRFPSNLPLTHYKDISHLNVRGQRVFMDWLFDRLTDEVKTND